MKKVLLLIITIILFVPLIANAQSKFLYDVLKNEAENNGLAREYTGEHHDSFTEEPSKKIYHWYAENDDEGNQILEKNNIVFAGKCWKMIRTTDTGGVKIMFNGSPTEGKCISNNSINNSYYSPSGKNGLVNVGYMYYSNMPTRYDNNPSNNSLFGNGVTYSDGLYTLTDTSTTSGSNHHYTCNNTTGTCENVRYYVFLSSSSSYKYYYVLTNGKTISDIIDNIFSTPYINSNDSSIKANIDYWYQGNMINYNDYFEDTIFCNNREVYNLGMFNPNGGSISSIGATFLFKTQNEQSNLSCPNEYDKFSVNNSKAKLKYPVALITSYEMGLFNNNKARILDGNYWTMTPYGYGINGASVLAVSSDGSLEANNLLNDRRIKPVVSLKSKIKYTTGDGSKNDPYVIANLVQSNIIVNNDNSKGTFTISDTDNITELSDISFTVESNEGYRLKNIQIKDSNNNIIEYINSGNNYSFEMPDSNVTITTNYEALKYGINVEIVNETENLNVDIDDLTQIEYNTEVSFNVTAIKGYKVTGIKIIDSNNNEIDYNTIDNNRYKFIMPNSDVTIIPSYERVSNGVEVENNSNTKEIVIEVNDATAVVYEDKVRFKVVPESGYEVEKIIIKDKNNNTISYKKLSNKNEYEFTMPDTDVTITPVYRKIESNSKPNIINPKTVRPFITILILIGLVIVSILIRKKIRLNKDYL